MRTRNGFTLLELAIVVTIIALITGMIFMGRNAIRDAQLKTMLSDAARYQQAINDFRDKYGSLPGDMANATSYWGAIADCVSQPYVATYDMATCDGNGNERIDTAFETFRAWQQLYNAGLIEVAYTGSRGSVANASHFVTGVNSPAAIEKGLFVLQFVNAPTGDAGHFPINMRHELYITNATGANGIPNVAIVTAEEAQSIDTKTDDGMPGLGKVQAPKRAVMTCATTDVAETTRYDFTSTDLRCAPKFIMGF